MLIGIVGDTHNNLKNIAEICNIFNSKKVNLVIHTGDVTLPKSLNSFKSLNMKLIGVFGNNDQAEKKDLLRVCNKFKCEFHDEPHFLILKGKKISILHDPLIIDKDILKKSDFIFHGHTHRFRNEKIDKTCIFNPGECAGFMKGKNQVGIVNLDEERIELIKF